MTRRQINFIQGANVTIGVVDVGGDGEIEVTITAAGATPPLITGATSQVTTVANGAISGALGNYDAVVGGSVGLDSGSIRGSSFSSVASGADHVSWNESGPVVNIGTGAVWNAGGGGSCNASSSTAWQIGTNNSGQSLSSQWLGLF